MNDVFEWAPTKRNMIPELASKCTAHAVAIGSAKNAPKLKICVGHVAKRFGLNVPDVDA